MLIPYRDINPTVRPPIVTVTLISANILVYVGIWVASGFSARNYNAYVYFMGLVPSRLLSLDILSVGGPVPVALTPITAMFMHGSILHLAGNMLYLWIFGNNVEDYMGHFKFLIFYLLTGLAASFAHILLSLGSDVPMIGASGAVAGVLGAYFVLWPRARVRTILFLVIFVTIVELPALVVLGLWILIQIAEGLGSIGASSGVAWFAHIGGFFAGFGLTMIGLKSGRRRPARKYRIVN